jgi:hypothetical protein
MSETVTFDPNLPISMPERIMLGEVSYPSKLGAFVLAFERNQDGKLRRKMEHNPPTEISADLMTDFRKEPVEVLSRTRDSIFAIASDSRLSSVEKEYGVAKYFEAGAALNLRLDSLLTPPEARGVLHEGAPEYFPHNFADLGQDPSRYLAGRTRDIILLDKKDLFQKYKADLVKIFLDPKFEGLDSAKKETALAITLAGLVYGKVPFNIAMDEAKGVTKLSQINEGVCRHQALTYQALCQFMGVKSRVIKNYVSFENDQGRLSTPGSHASNAVNLGGEWYLLDVTNPDHEEKDGVKTWRPGAIKIDEDPTKQTKKYSGRLKYSKKLREYRTRQNMNWLISGRDY